MGTVGETQRAEDNPEVGEREVLGGGNPAVVLYGAIEDTRAPGYEELGIVLDVDGDPTALLGTPGCG